MPNAIQLKRSTSNGAAPSSLQVGEFAINEADQKLFFRNAAGTVVSVDLASLRRVITISSSAPSGGSDGDLWIKI